MCVLCVYMCVLCVQCVYMCVLYLYMCAVCTVCTHVCTVYTVCIHMCTLRPCGGQRVTFLGVGSCHLPIFHRLGQGLLLTRIGQEHEEILWSVPPRPTSGCPATQVTYGTLPVLILRGLALCSLWNPGIAVGCILRLLLFYLLLLGSPFMINENP